jgi:hypothetical protein
MFEVTVIETLRQWLMLHITRFVPVGLPQLLPSVLQFQAAKLTLRIAGSTCFQADGELYEGFPAEGQDLTVRHATHIELIFV